MYTAKAAFKDDGKTRPLKDWMLKNFIDVARELGWITLQQPRRILVRFFVITGITSIRKRGSRTE